VIIQATPSPYCRPKEKYVLDNSTVTQKYLRYTMAALTRLDSRYRGMSNISKSRANSAKTKSIFRLSDPDLPQNDFTHHVFSKEKFRWSMISGFKRDVRETTLRGHVRRKGGRSLGPPWILKLLAETVVFSI